MSDRQLNDLWWYWLRMDHSLAVSTGYAWQYLESLFTLSGGGQEVIYIRTSSKPVAIWNISLDTDQSRGAIIEFHFGGDVTPGPELHRVPLNQHMIQAEPFVSFAAPSVLVAPGVELATALTGEGSNTYEFEMVLRPNDDYYLTIDNLSNQTAVMNFALTAGQISYPMHGKYAPAPVNLWPGNVSANVGVTVDDDGFDITFPAPNQAYVEWSGSNASGRRYRLETQTEDVFGLCYIRGADGLAQISPEFQINGEKETLFDIPQGETGWQLFVEGSLSSGRVDAQLYEVPT